MARSRSKKAVQITCPVLAGWLWRRLRSEAPWDNNRSREGSRTYYTQSKMLVGPYFVGADVLSEGVGRSGQRGLVRRGP